MSNNNNNLPDYINQTKKLYNKLSSIDDNVRKSAILNECIQSRLLKVSKTTSYQSNLYLNHMSNVLSNYEYIKLLSDIPSASNMIYNLVISKLLK